jgi:hypothetical protein
MRWYVYSGPTNAAFANAAQTNTTATFPLAGTYTLMLSASNGLHTTAYDAVVINVGNGIRATIQRTGTNATLRWTGGTPPYAVESAARVPTNSWTTVTNVTTNTASVPISAAAAYYRIRSQ